MSYDEVVKFIRGMGGYTQARTELRRMLGEQEGTGVTTEIANLTQGALIARLTQATEQGEGSQSIYTGGRGLGENRTTGDEQLDEEGLASVHGDGGEVEGGGHDGDAGTASGASGSSGADGEGRAEQQELELDDGILDDNIGSTGRGRCGQGGGRQQSQSESGQDDGDAILHEDAPEQDGEGDGLPSEPVGDAQADDDDELRRLEEQLEAANAEAERAADERRQMEQALEEARRRAEERRRKEEEQRRKAEEEAKRKAEREAKRQAEEAKRKAKEEAKRKAEEQRNSREEAMRRVPAGAHSKTSELVETLKTTGLAFLVGPAGSGKTSLAVGACEVIFGVKQDDPEFNKRYAQISFSPDTTAGEMIGRYDVNGGFTESEIVRVFRDGGLILFDEVDNADASMLVKLNTAIANGYIATPNGLVRRNENTVLVCTGNTFGTGADAMYVGRARLDAATLDRFTLCTIFVDYDTKLEGRIAKDGGLDAEQSKWLSAFVKAVRKCIESNRFRRICSTRFVVNGVRWLKAGKPRKWVADKFLLPWKESERKAVESVLIGDAALEPVAQAS